MDRACQGEEAFFHASCGQAVQPGRVEIAVGGVEQHALAQKAGEQAALFYGLVGAAALEFGGPVGSDEEQRYTRAVGFDGGWEPVPGGTARGGEEQGWESAGLGQAQGEEGGAALVHQDVTGDAAEP
jgi:hypothetical protein